MSEPTNKAKLLDGIRTEHQQMEQLLSRLTPEQLTAPVFNAGWSVKDHLVHLTVWEKLMLGWVAASVRGETVVRFTPEFIETEESGQETMNRLNDHLYEQNKSRALDDVLADFRQTHEQVLTQLSQLTEEDIFKPNRFAWRHGASLYGNIEGNTSGHYREHRGWIQAKF